MNQKKKKQPQPQQNSKNKYLDKTDYLLNTFLEEIRHFPIYSNKKLIFLITKAKEGDVEAKEKIVESCSRFVVSIAKHFQSTSINIIDLIQEGFFGLLTAIDKYDPSKKVPFVHFASWWIKKNIIRYIEWYKATVRLPENQQKAFNKLVDISTNFLAHEERIPSVEELSEKSELPKWIVSQYYAILNSNNTKEIINIDNIQDELVMDKSINPEIILDEKLKNDTILQCLQKLELEQQEFIQDYFGINRYPLKIKDLADKYLLTISGVEKKKIKILKILKDKCSNILKPYR